MSIQDEQELATRAAFLIPSNAEFGAGTVEGGGVAVAVDGSASDVNQESAADDDGVVLNGPASISNGAPATSGERPLGSARLDGADLLNQAQALGGNRGYAADSVAENASAAPFADGLSAPASSAGVVADTQPAVGASAGGGLKLEAVASTSAAALGGSATKAATQEIKLNGVNYVADIYGSFAAANSLNHVVAANVNAVAVVADFGIDAKHDLVYDNDVAGGFTDSDDDIAATISKAAGLGLGVMVRPLIDFLPANYDGAANPLNAGYSNDEWRTYFNPGAAGSSGANSFFASYQAMIVGEAKLAQANGASIMSIGVELDQLTGPAYKNYWTNIITAVRAVFSGKLTYGADWDDADSPWQYGGTGLPVGTGNIATQISFWSQLDYVGIDEYAPISDLANPTVAQLVAGWEQAPTDAVTRSVTGDQSLISYYQSVAASTGKPLLFTELGYANSSDAASSPATPGYDENGNPDNATADPTLQANLYTAFYQAWEQDGNGSLAGVYLWDWEPGGKGISPFSPQGLPALTSLTDNSAFGAAPVVTSIATTITNPGPNSRSFAVTFSEAVTGLAADDFTLAITNTSGGTPVTADAAVGISGSGANYVVTVDDIVGEGVLGLDFKANSTNVVNGAGDDALAGYTSGQTYTVDIAPCYCRGARILTHRGEIAVEDLRIGDLAITASGHAKAVVWLGHRKLDLLRHRYPEAVRPVRVCAHAFGPGLPKRDLWLSPGHNVVWDGALMPISSLVNGLSVAQIPQERVEYWHVELEAHDILLAEGLPAESYLDCGNRTAFANGGAFVEAHPDFAPKHWRETCLPLVKQGPQVVAAKARLLARLVSHGYGVDENADAHILVDGRRLDPIGFTPSRLAFAIPQNAREIVLRSNAFVPAHTMAESTDGRELGLCVARLQIDGADLALDDDANCGSGWSGAEFSDGRFLHRWTTGAAPLPVGSRIVIVDLAGRGHYWRKPAAGAAARRA